MTSAPVRLTFSGHQSFPLRYAWLPKVAAILPSQPDLFSRDDALVLLGVGKNMVFAVDYWAKATGIIEPLGPREDRLTLLGERLIGPDGIDPYLETYDSLWMLHWQLVRIPDRASTWHYAFTRWNRSVFSREELLAWLLGIVSQSRLSRATPQSLKRDVEVFLRSYAPPKHGKRRAAEDSFDCPLSQLGLIQEIEPGLFAFSRGEQPTLNPAVLILSIADFWHLHAPNQETMTFERLLHGAGSPGNAFQLSDRALLQYLETLPSDAGFSYDESAGMRRLVRFKTLEPSEIIERFADAVTPTTRSKA